jgi:SAM-dependent methyltransferase
MRHLYQTRMAGYPWMHRCPVCELCAVAPVPSGSGEEYEDAYTAGSEADRKNRRLAPDYFRKIAPHLPRQPFRFIEVGGSHGWLAQLVRDNCTADVLLLEPGRTAVAAAKGRGLHAEAGFLEQFQVDQPFDVLCAAHVIEHVSNLGSFLEACRRTVRPGGRVLLLTPNAIAWKLSRFRAAWAWAVPEQHTFLLSPDSARRLLEKNGFQPDEIAVTRAAFAHYPFFVARWLSELRANWPALLRKAAGLITRPIAIAEYALLRTLDSCIQRNGADELLIVATRHE